MKAYKGIEVINELAKNNNLFIISASPNEQADKDKLKWISKYLPNICTSNITLCRLGENKAQIIREKYAVTFDAPCFFARRLHKEPGGSGRMQVELE